MKHLSVLLILMGLVAVGRGFAEELECLITSSEQNAQTGFTCVHEGQLSYCTSEASPSFQTTLLSGEASPIRSVMALQGDHIGDVIADLVLKSEETPICALVQDKNREEYVVLIDETGKVSISSMNSLLKSSLVPFDEGREGYGIKVHSSSYFKIWPCAQ